MTTCLYDGDNVIADISGGSVVKSYVTPMLDANVSMTVHGATNETYYYNQDERQSVVNLTDSTGVVVQSHGYSAYGVAVDALTSGDVKQRYTYTGRELSEASGDYYFRYRWYGAASGSFFVRDQLRYIDGPSLYLGYFTQGLGLDPEGLRWRRLGYGYGTGDPTTGNKFIATEDGDKLETLAWMVSKNPTDWPCLWPVEWKDPETYKAKEASKCDIVDVSNLTAKTGPTVKMRAPGNDRYTRALAAVMGQPGIWPSGRKAASHLKRVSGQGGKPIHVAYLGAHHVRGSEDLIDDQLRVSFNAGHVFQEAMEKDNGKNSYANAVKRIGPPKCWFTRNSNVWGIGCNTNSVWLKDWATKIMRKGSTVHGTKNYVAGLHGKIWMSTINFRRLSQKAQNLKQLNLLHWQPMKGTQ